MKFSIRKRSITIVAFMMVSNCCYSQVPAANLPRFSFLKLDNTTFTSKETVTNKLLFFCFFDVTCTHCQHAIEQISQHYNQFSNTAIYLISLDNKEAMKAFIATHGKNLLDKKNVTLLQDSKNQFITIFSPRKYPSMFLYGANKKLLLYDDNEADFSSFLKIITTKKIR